MKISCLQAALDREVVNDEWWKSVPDSNQETLPHHNTREYREGATPPKWNDPSPDTSKGHPLKRGGLYC